MDSLKPGRELDKLVAEAMGLNVLGLAPCIINPECFGYNVAIDGRGDISQPVYIKRCMCYDKDPDDFIILGHTAFCLEVVPPYSTDISAAWVAWEWLEENSGWGSVALFRDAGGPTVGAMRLYRDKKTGEIFDIAQKKWQGESSPHAICLAVLEASKGKR